MNITPELQAKINNIAASHFLSEGNYETLQKAIEGDERAIYDITIWQPFEHEDYEKVMEHVEELVDSIVDLISEL